MKYKEVFLKGKNTNWHITGSANWVEARVRNLISIGAVVVER